jgi:uncharacterized phiE125 gp8 family phage protein
MATAVRPTRAIVPVEELKAWLRIVGSEEDALLAALIRSATELCEQFTRLALIERDVEQTLPGRPVWSRLEQGPVRAILGVSALGADGEAAPLAAGDYALDVDAAGAGWVRVLRSGAAQRVLVRYRAGLGADWNGVPEALRHGVVRMAAHLYARRDGDDGAAPPAAVAALWLPYRKLRLA